MNLTARFTFITMNEPEVMSIESEAGFKALFEFATVGIVVINKKGHIELANPCVQKMFGYENVELIGQPVEILIPESLRKKHVHHREGYFERPKARPMGSGLELYAHKKDGEEFPVEISLGHYDFNGEIFAVAFVTDITQGKHDREVLVQLEERFSKAFNSSPVAKSISGLDDGIIVDVNESFLFLFEYTRAEVIGHSADELKLFGNEDERKRLLQTLRNHGKVRNLELTVYSKSMKPIEILLSSEIISLDGKEHLLTTRVDITEKKKAEQELIKMNQELENRVRERTEELTESLEREKELGELKSRFVSMASHEFRTPLSAILSSVSLIGRYTEPEQIEKRQKHIDRIKSSVQNLTDILNDFLSLDKLEQGKIEVEKESIDLKEFVEDILEEMHGVVKEGQKIKHIHQGKNEIFQDRKIIRNVLLNLLSNAVKYSGENEEIILTTSVNDKDVSIIVKDNGIGIPVEEQQHLFTKFFRAKNAVNIQGSGLGLTIIKRYVELLRGTITFTSAVNEGTTFIVEFPNQEKK